MADNTIKIFTIKVDTQSGELKINGVTKSFKEAEIALKDLNQQSIKTTKSGLNPLTGATGLAGAAVTELGRTVSDLNYGFPAVANNISQLGSLFTILTTKAGGAKGAFQLILKEMKGPLGILFAFQIGITLLEAISKGFFDTGKEAKKASEELKKLKGELAGNIVVANQYVKILEDTNTSERKRASVIEELKDLVPSLKDEDFKYGQQLDIVKQKIIDYSIAQASRIEIDKLVEENSELLAKRRKINIINEIKDEEEKAKAIRKFAEENEFNLTSTTSSFGIQAKEVEKSDEKIKKSFENRSKTTIEESDKILEKINELSNGFDFGYVKEKKASKLRKDFIAKELSFADEILKSQDKVNKKITKSQFIRLEQEEELQKKLARIKFDEYKERELARANAIKDPEDRRKAIEKANEAIGRSLVSLSQYEIQLTKETQDKKTQIIADAIVKQFDLATQLNAKEREAILGFEASMATNDLDKIDAEKRLEEEKLTNKLNALDIEKQKRIENDEFYGDILIKEEQAVNASERQKTKFKEKEEKARLGIANQVGQAIMSIAGEGSAVGKAVAVAMAIMNTKEAVTAALGAKPYGPWNIAQAVATGVFGMQQVREIMSTKLPAAAGGSGGGAGASMSVSAPDFNVVGAGGASQVAQAVTSSQDRPFRAYVVSGDVTSAQELDRKTLTESAIG
jgi:hypothetical protein